MASVTTGITTGSFKRNSHQEGETYLLPDAVEHVVNGKEVVNMNPERTAGKSNPVSRPARRK
jgi:hypothetical protein